MPATFLLLNSERFRVAGDSYVENHQLVFIN